MADKQNTWWFRLLKILWIAGFAIVLVAIVGFVTVYSKDSTTLDKGQSYFLCDTGKRIGFEEINSSNIYSSYLGDSEKREIKRKCIEGDQALAFTAPTDAGIDKLKPNFKMYQAEKHAMDIGPLLGYTALGLLAAIIVFELIKRVFYYIVFGKLII